VDTVTRYHHYRDELDKRRAQHVNLDEALSGALLPGERRSKRASTDMYQGRLEEVVRQWENRWWSARLLELSHFSLSEVLTQFGRGISCRSSRMSPETLIARAIGRNVHSVIQTRYRQYYRGHRVSLDNRIHAVGGSEQLAKLARQDPRSEYATLNFALAGTRSDIVNFYLREMWEIKPAALASEAVLQLWAYLDNHEVARVFNNYSGHSTPGLEPGNPLTLPPAITEPFQLRIKGLRVPLTIQPYTHHRLPGLILYTVEPGGRRRGKEAAAQAMATGRVQLNQLLAAAGRDAAERRESEVRFWEAAERVATVTAVGCGVVLVVSGGVLLLAPAGAGAGAGVTTAASAETVALAQNVISLAARRELLKAATREAITEVSKKAAGIVVITVAGQRLEVPAEAAGFALDLGLGAGTSVMSEEKL
jgi:hypothetical protein